MSLLSPDQGGHPLSAGSGRQLGLFWGGVEGVFASLPVCSWFDPDPVVGSPGQECGGY